MRISRKHIILLFLLILASGSALADDAMIKFNRGYTFLTAKSYQDAFSQFYELCNNYPDHDKYDQFLFFQGKSAYYAERFGVALASFNDLIREHSESAYLPHAFYFQGNANYRDKDVSGALDSYLSAYARSTDQELDRLTMKSIKAMLPNLNGEHIAKLKRAEIPSGKRCPLMISLSETLLESGNFQAVTSLLESCTDPQANYLSRRARDNMKQKTEIGVVLPLSGELKKYGDQLLDGIMLAVDECIAQTGRQINTVVYDTKGDKLEAARIVKNLSNSGAMAAIGPLTSDECAVASATLSCDNMPLIIPAAGEGGLTELSSSAYQMQANLDLQGIKMADFAIQYLEADTAAIITPTSSENLRMAGTFKKRFEERGGVILGVEYFRSRDSDFGPYVRDLKEIIIDDLLDSIIFIDIEGDTIEAEEVPVWLDCLFIPASGSQLRQLLPQINFYNINTTYLGSDGWGAEAVYRMEDRVLKSPYFASGLIEDYVSEKFIEFAQRFDLRHGRQPGRLEKLGYDAASLICEALASGNLSRAEINNYLSGVVEFDGVAGKISFGANRENIILPIYTIKDGVPKRVNLQDKHE